jgi:hypothetical protein
MVGIFTGTDYLNKIIRPGRKSKGSLQLAFSLVFI